LPTHIIGTEGNLISIPNPAFHHFAAIKNPLPSER
jgi:hypothetical protein